MEAVGALRKGIMNELMNVSQESYDLRSANNLNTLFMASLLPALTCINIPT